MGINNHIVKNKIIMMTKMATRRKILCGFAIICMMNLGLPAAAWTASNLITKGNTVLPPPDYDAAVQSEYDRVVKKATREAYQRFIRRHPDHPLAGKARDAIANDDLQ